MIILGLIGTAIIGLFLWYISIFIGLLINESPLSFISLSLFLAWAGIYISLKRLSTWDHSNSQAKRIRLPIVLLSQRLITSLIAIAIIGWMVMSVYANQTCSLAYASRSGSMMSIRLFLLMGAQVDDSQCHTTSLMYASDKPKITQVLLQNLANVKLVNRRGQTPLHLVRGPKSDQVASLLIQAGADVNGEDKHGKTPIYYAIWRKHKRLIQTLIDYGSDLNHQDYRGQTPLHRVDSTDQALIDLLLNAAADSTLLDDDNRVPLECTQSEYKINNRPIYMSDHLLD